VGTSGTTRAEHSTADSGKRWYIGMHDGSRSLTLRVLAGTAAEGKDVAEAMMRQGDTLVIECRRNVAVAELAAAVSAGDSVVAHLGDDCVQLFVQEQP
jgi:hypothetical protein